MPRPANAIDFWRGFALITIFINHIPGIVFDRFTHRNFSYSDSAELFVFLAGWSLRHVVGSPTDTSPFDRLMFRLGGRAVAIYAAHMTIVMLAIAMLAMTSIWLDNPLVLEWNNASAVFSDPVNTHIGLVLLSHQLGYFDILPLYVVLMLVAPLVAIIHRTMPAILLPASVILYIATLVFQWTVPTWPNEGQWFFNPLCWQVIFVLGFSLSRERGPGGWVQRNLRPIRIVAIPVLMLFTFLTLIGWTPDPIEVPDPKLLFIAGKTFVTPIRLIQFLALVAVFSALYPYFAPHLPKLVSFCSLLGRHSLQVFCVGSLLSLAGQIIHFVSRGDVLIDTAYVIAGIALLGITAWMSEWRERSKGSE